MELITAIQRAGGGEVKNTLGILLGIDRYGKQNEETRKDVGEKASCRITHAERKEKAKKEKRKTCRKRFAT